MYVSRGYESQARLMINQMNMANERVFLHQSRITSGDSFKGRIDNPVDVVKASRAEAVMRGNRAAEGNIQDALSFLQVKESGLAKMDQLGQRLRELSVQFSNETLVSEDREALALEALSLLEEMDYTMKNTTFNQINVFADKPVHIQAGDRSGDVFVIQPTTIPFDGGIEIEDMLPPPSLGNDSGNPKPNEQGTEQGEGLPGMDAPEETESEGKGQTTSTTTTETKTETTTTTTTETPSGNNIAEDGTHNQGVNETENDGANEAGGPNGTPSSDEEYAALTKFLSSGFIDEHILKPIALERAKVGVESNRLEYRLESVMNEGAEAMGHLSRIRDTDIAKEYMEMVKQQMLADVNANMMTRAMNDRRSMVLSLLYS